VLTLPQAQPPHKCMCPHPSSVMQCTIGRTNVTPRKMVVYHVS